MSQRRRIPGTRRRAGVRVDPQLQAQRMDLRRSAADAVREPRGIVLETPGLDVAVGERPAVVDVDVLVAGGAQAQIEDLLCCDLCSMCLLAARTASVDRGISEYIEITITTEYG